MTQTALAEGQRYLDRLAQRLRVGGRQVYALALLAAPPAVGILDAARAHRADLIALATHGRSGLARLLSLLGIGDSATLSMGSYERL
jgi:nucleotide-binding universal stress UspA family protein